MLKLANQHGDAERQAQEMFQRVLVGWACDALILRAAGLDRPGHRTAWGSVSPTRVRRIGPQAWTTPIGRVA